MKKTLLMTIMALLVSMASFAAEELGAPKFYTIPAVFTPTDQVTIYFDMSETGFKDGVDLYWWCWQPTEPDAGHWESSSDFAKLEYMGDFMYKKTFVPVDYFFQNQDRFATKEELAAWMMDPADGWGEAGYWSRLKTSGDEYQSGVFCVNHTRDEIVNFKDGSAEMQVMSGGGANTIYAGYSDKWTMDKPLSILFNGDLVKIEGKTLNEIGATGAYIGTHAGIHGFYTDADDNMIEYDFADPPAKNINQQWNVWREGCLRKAGLRNCGNGVWKWDLETPARYFAYNPVNADEGPHATDPTYGPYWVTDAGMVGPNGEPQPNPEFIGSFEAQELKFGLIGGMWDMGANFNFAPIKAGSAEAYPDPAFSYFPSRISKYDIITLIRQWNGRTDGDLKWTITAGGKSFSGVMGGNRDKRQGSANLLKELSGVAAGNINVVIKNSKDAEVVNVNIPLTEVDE